MFDYDDRVIHLDRRGRVQESTSDESLVQFDDGEWVWIYNNELELEW